MQLSLAREKERERGQNESIESVYKCFRLQRPPARRVMQQEIDREKLTETATETEMEMEATLDT